MKIYFQHSRDLRYDTLWIVNDVTSNFYLPATVLGAPSCQKLALRWHLGILWRLCLILCLRWNQFRHPENVLRKVRLWFVHSYIYLWSRDIAGGGGSLKGKKKEIYQLWSTVFRRNTKSVNCNPFNVVFVNHSFMPYKLDHRGDSSSYNSQGSHTRLQKDFLYLLRIFLTLLKVTHGRVMKEQGYWRLPTD